MNLAFCYESVIPARGGCETYIADLLRRLAVDGHELHLYSQERDAAALPSGLVFHQLPKTGGPRFLRPWRFGKACEQALEGQIHDVVVGFVKTWRQDVIIPQGGLHRASVEHNVHKHPPGWRRVLGRMSKWLNLCTWSYARLERKQYSGKHSPVVVAPSRMVQEHFRRYLGFPADRIHVVPNAIDPARFEQPGRRRARSELRVELGIHPDEPVALFIGHNYRLKGLEPLLRAVQALPVMPFQLLVCGSARTASFERMASRLGIASRVRFLGYRKDVQPCFFGADFLVHPTFYDPCSLVVLEALACGLPVITTRFNGAAEILNPPHDGLVLEDPHNHHDLARYIEWMCDATRRAAASAAARRTGNSWTFEDHYRALLNVLNQVAQRRRVA